MFNFGFLCPILFMAFFVFLLLLFLIPAAVAGRFNYTCPAEFECGNLGIVKFPFANFTQPDCGLSMFDCTYQPLPSITLSRSSGQWFVTQKKLQKDQNIISVRDLFLHRLLLLAENNNTIRTSTCDLLKYIVFLPNSLSISYSIKYNITIFRCRKYPPYSQDITDYFRNNNYRKYESCEEFDVLYRNPKYYGYPKENEVPDQPICSSITIPMLPWDDPHVVSKDSELLQMLTADFDLEWRVSDRCYRDCHLKGGRCETNDMNEFSCVSSAAAAAGRVHRRSAKRKIILIAAGVSISVSIIALLAILIFLCFRRKIFLISDSVKFWKQSGADKNQELETFLKKYESMTPKRYSYADVKKMTNSFNIKLGQGGYGTVYKGKLILKNGTTVPVAVKILNESNGNGEEFTNEVDCISRTSHINIVNLLGFCFEGSKKRALIYEFFVNGSLEKFIYGGKKLEWPILYKIAVGIGRGLEYLHCGCNTRILHFDIKPHNILLDEEFCPKITDFGLAKLCARKESMVSTMAARGTVGYIAPEIVCKNIGSVSHKSDVYSYGMMVLEMVGGRKNVNVEADRDSEIYFPHWIYTRLMERGQDLGLSGIKSDEENKLARKMLIVSLWCIQTDPFCRPTISNVLEMLEGTTDLDALQMPPKFFFHAPSTASSQGTTTTAITTT